MEKAEIKRIADFINDTWEGICGGDEPTTMQLQLTELYRIIKKLMDATYQTKDQQLKVLLASLEYKARRCKQYIEARTGVRN